MELNFVNYTLIGGSSYLPLPKDIENKKAIINIKNSDNKCFAYSIISHFYPAKSHNENDKHYQKYLNEINLNNISFPMQLEDISKFEKQNLKISVNVLGLDVKNNKHVVCGPLYHTKQRKENHINLLYLEDSKTGKTHYCYIKNLSRLLSSQNSKNEHRLYICDGCFIKFVSEKKLKEHLSLKDCLEIQTLLPDASNNIIEHKDYYKSFPMPFCIYADFETFLEPICNVNKTSTKATLSTCVHKAFSFAYYVKCEHNSSLSFLKQYRGLNCVEVFVKWLIQDTREIYKSHFLNPVAMKKLTLDQQYKHDKAQTCFLCNSAFSYTTNGMRKVFDHDHFTGLYIYNLTNYEGKLIV